MVTPRLTPTESLTRELKEGIASFLEVKDKTDLRSLSLVSKSFYDAARPHLYRDITVECEGRYNPKKAYGSNIYHLIRTLVAKPELGHLIKSVTFTYSTTKRPKPISKSDGSRMGKLIAGVKNTSIIALGYAIAERANRPYFGTWVVSPSEWQEIRRILAVHKSAEPRDNWSWSFAAERGEPVAALALVLLLAPGIEVFGTRDIQEDGMFDRKRMTHDKPIFTAARERCFIRELLHSAYFTQYRILQAQRAKRLGSKSKEIVNYNMARALDPINALYASYPFFSDDITKHHLNHALPNLNLVIINSLTFDLAAQLALLLPPKIKIAIFRDHSLKTGNNNPRHHLVAGGEPNQLATSSVEMLVFWGIKSSNIRYHVEICPKLKTLIVGYDQATDRELLALHSCARVDVSSVNELYVFWKYRSLDKSSNVGLPTSANYLKPFKGLVRLETRLEFVTEFQEVVHDYKEEDVGFERHLPVTLKWLSITARFDHTHVDPVTMAGDQLKYIFKRLHRMVNSSTNEAKLETLVLMLEIHYGEWGPLARCLQTEQRWSVAEFERACVTAGVDFQIRVLVETAAGGIHNEELRRRSNFANGFTKGTYGYKFVGFEDGRRSDERAEYGNQGLLFARPTCCTGY